MKKSIYVLIALALVFAFSLAWQQSTAQAQAPGLNSEGSPWKVDFL